MPAAEKAGNRQGGTGRDGAGRGGDVSFFWNERMGVGMGMRMRIILKDITLISEFVRKLR